MKIRFSIVFAVLVLIFVAVQFIPSGIPANKPEDGKSIANDSLMTEPVIEQLRISCIDCHSNQVTLPWYSKVAPFSWLLASHIDEGRSHLNFSEWGLYSNREKIGILEEIRDEVASGGMPLKSYLMIHRDARLDSAAVSGILTWVDDATASILE
mgnify:CR=1 FL=1